MNRILNHEDTKTRRDSWSSRVASCLRDFVVHLFVILRRFTPAALVHFGLLVAALISLTPFVWLLCASLKRGEDLFAYTFLPWHHLKRLSTDNFTELFQKEAFGR